MNDNSVAHGQADITRSTRYYLPGCDLVIRAEHILYGVDETAFRSRSGALGNLLDTQRSKDPQFGSSDHRPLVIEVEARSMDSFMEAFWDSEAFNSMWSIGKLIHVLQLSYIFEVQDLYLGTIRKLDDHPGFSDSAARLRWSLEVNVKEWFAPAFSQLASLPMSAMSLGRLVIVGHVWSYHLIQARKKIEVCRALLAISDPVWEQVRWCVRKKRCMKGWLAFWRRNVSPTLLGDLPVSDEVIAGWESSTPPNTCLRCFTACMAIAKQKMSDEKRVLQEEVEMLRGEFFGN